MSKGAGKVADKGPRITTPSNKQAGIISWDFDNNYPARMRNVVADSVTASNCLKVYNRFVMGRGLADPDFAVAKVNDNNETADKVIRRLIADKGFIGAFAVHFNYNSVYEKVTVTPLKIDSCRIGEGDKKGKIAIHPNWEKRKDKKAFKPSDIEYFDVYNPDPTVIEQQVADAGGWENYKGQVMFWTPFGVEYTVAPWDPSAEDMETEGGLKTFRSRAVGQNFLPSQYIVVDAMESADEATSGDEAGSSFGDVIVDTIKQFQGPENTASVMVIEKPSPDTSFELHAPDLQHFDGMYEKTEQSTEAAILRGFMMPRPLILEGGDALFASGEIMAAATEYYNLVTEDDRLEMAEAIAEIFSGFAEEVCPSGDFSLLPLLVKKKIGAEYFPYFTKNEIRESLDALPVEEVSAEKKMLVETIGVGGTQSLVSILTDPVLSEVQKSEALKLLFNFTDEQAQALVYGDKSTTNDGTRNT